MRSRIVRIPNFLRVVLVFSPIPGRCAIGELGDIILPPYHTESLKDYTKNNVKREFRSLNEFIDKWNIIDQKRAIIEELDLEQIGISDYLTASGEEKLTNVYKCKI